MQRIPWVPSPGNIGFHFSSRSSETPPVSTSIRYVDRHCLRKLLRHSESRGWARDALDPGPKGDTDCSRNQDSLMLPSKNPKREKAEKGCGSVHHLSRFEYNYMQLHNWSRFHKETCHTTLYDIMSNWTVHITWLDCDWNSTGNLSSNQFWEIWFLDF